MLRLSGAELTIRLLENQGVTHIAGIPGGFNLPLYDALGRRGTIRHILARHEQGAGFIAQGMARVTGRPGVVFATSGPGATNTLTALADARMDSVPLVCITGQVPLGMIGAAGLYMAFVPGAPQPREDFSRMGLVVAGVLVGFGTRMGNGCTSGHGVCGIGRLSARSIVAVLTFMLTAVIATYMTRHMGFSL